MITSCTVCQARYQLEDDKVPRRVIRVRCPACGGVFSLDGSRLEQEKPVRAAAPPEPARADYATPRAPARATAPIRPTQPTQPVAAPKPAFSSAPAAIAEPATPAPDEPSAPRRRRCKEEMLARALVSDILVYNRDLRDTALREGNLLEALGGEIKKSWELYKEKVGPDVANNTDHFRTALNEILAEGTKVF
jgi:predicted Zn finger-like uncharacterized protein